jgi:hypothetical protein
MCDIEMKKPEYMPIGKYERHKTNPFIPETVDNVQIKKRTQMIKPTGRDAVHYVVNSETGEIDGHSAFLRVVEVDEERFVKLYLEGLRDVWDLSKPALRVFAYVMNCMRMNEDSIFFDPNECMEYTRYKAKKSVFNGLAELIEHGIIARSTIPYRYFINPMIVFNGSRVTFAKTYVKKRKQTEDPNQLKLFDEQEQLPAPEEGTSDEQSSG